MNHYVLGAAKRHPEKSVAWEAVLNPKYRAFKRQVVDKSL
jgi:hypothetical protein